MFHGYEIFLLLDEHLFCVCSRFLYYLSFQVFIANDL